MLVKSKLNRKDILIDLSIAHDEFALTNNVLKEYDERKEEIRNLRT